MLNPIIIVNPDHYQVLVVGKKADRLFKSIGKIIKASLNQSSEQLLVLYQRLNSPPAKNEAGIYYTFLYSDTKSEMLRVFSPDEACNELAENYYLDLVDDNDFEDMPVLVLYKPP